MSVAVQVTMLVPTGKNDGALLLTVMMPPQLSVMFVGVPRLTLVVTRSPGEANTLTCAGQLNAGGWLSVTTTCCWQEALLPRISVAVQVTMLVPTGKNDAALLLTVMMPPQLSVMFVGVPRLTLVAPHRPGEANTPTRAGQLNVGG